MPDIEQVKGKIILESDTKGAKEADDALSSFQTSLKNVSEIAAGIAIEHLAERFVGFAKDMVGSAVDMAGKFEQWKMAFDTMLGSSEKSSKLMAQISDFAQKTPFELPGLVEGSKQLIAFGVSSDDVVKRLGQLGDIAAGIGTDKLPLLIHAFGQVEAGSRLTGRELNEFVMSGVPILQALADHYNKVGVASDQMHTTIQKGTKMSAEQIKTLQGNIEETQARIKILNEEQVKGGIATDRHNLALMTANHTLQEYQDKLAGANKVVTTMGNSSKVTAEEVKKMIEENKVSAKDVETVLGEMTSKGGRFFDMMNNQSKTFNGIMSNIHDQFVRISLSIMGFDMDSNSSTFGQIKDGTLFDKIHKGAQKFLDFLNAHQKDIADFFIKMADGAGKIYDFLTTKLIPKLEELSNWFSKNKEVLELLAGFITLVVLPALVRMAVEGFILNIIQIGKFIAYGWQAVASLAGMTFGANALSISFMGLSIPIGLIILGLASVILIGYELITHWDSLAKAGTQAWNTIGNAIKMTIKMAIDWINQLIEGLAKISGGKINLGKIDYGSNLNFNPNDWNTSKQDWKSNALEDKINSIESMFNKGQGSASGLTGMPSGVSITNYNEFNTPYDPTNFSKQLGLQVSLAR